MANENALLNEEKELDDDLLEMIDIDALELKIQEQLEEELFELEFLESEKVKIGNPDELGKIILDEIWSQFGNQIGLDITNETTIQKYDREHPETYDEVGKAVMRDKKYRDANNEMKKQQESGNLKDEYTGKDIKANESANLDHVVSRKEIYENDRRKQAGLSTEDLANKSENLKATNESLNKSKGAKSVDEYIDKRKEREEELKNQNDRANKKIDESNLSYKDKEHQKEKNNKRLQDKLDADDELMKDADNKARKSINRDIRIGATKEIGKKVAKDGLKQIVVSALFTMLKEIMNGLVKFLKSSEKTFNKFLESIKKSIGNFFNQIKGLMKNGVSSMIGTMVSEIFGPIVSLFKKLASFIKQGVKTLIEAIKYFFKEENKDKPFAIKIANVGKIIVSGLVIGSAISLSGLFEGILLGVPGMQITIPLLGSLANIVGLFLSSLISGIVGAIVMNFIDKFVAKYQKKDILDRKIDKSNDILILQEQEKNLSKVKFEKNKLDTFNIMRERHIMSSNMMRESLDKIKENVNTDDTIEESFDELDYLLKKLEG